MSCTNACGASRKNGRLGIPKPSSTPEMNGRTAAVHSGKQMKTAAITGKNAHVFTAPANPKSTPASKILRGLASSPAAEHDHGAQQAEEHEVRIESQRVV